MGGAGNRSQYFSRGIGKDQSVLMPVVNDRTRSYDYTRNVAVAGLNRFRLRRGKRHDRNSGLSIYLLIDILPGLLPGKIDSF